jgi:hypothetical protein
LLFAFATIVHTRLLITQDMAAVASDDNKAVAAPSTNDLLDLQDGKFSTQGELVHNGVDSGDPLS